MIFACYAGTGKTTAAAMKEDTLDLLLAPYKYRLPELPQGTYEEREVLKATDHDDFDIFYPRKYADAVEDAAKQYKHVLIPTDESVLEELNKRKIGYMIVIPDFRQENMKAFYEERYRKRGNNDRFLRIFIGQWERRMLGLMLLEKPCILLAKDRFVSDVILDYEE